MVKWSQSYKSLNSAYFTYKSLPLSESNKTQIQKDIERTQPHVDSFKTPKYLSMLKSILEVYSTFDSEVGYVQGMNILVSGLLYHIKDEEDTFWVFCKMMQECNLRKLFLQGF